MTQNALASPQPDVDDRTRYEDQLVERLAALLVAAYRRELERSPRAERRAS